MVLFDKPSANSYHEGPTIEGMWIFFSWVSKYWPSKSDTYFTTLPHALQEVFVAKVTTMIEKKNEDSQEVLSGWFTPEQMKTELKWSTSLVFSENGFYICAQNLDSPWYIHIFKCSISLPELKAVYPLIIPGNLAVLLHGVYISFGFPSQKIPICLD